MKHIFVIDSNSFSEETWKMDVIYKEIVEYFEAKEEPYNWQAMGDRRSNRTGGRREGSADDRRDPPPPVKAENPDYFIVISKYRRDAIVLIQQGIDKFDFGEDIRVYAIGGEEILFDCLNGIAGIRNIEFAIMPFEDACAFLNNFGEENLQSFKDIKSLIQAPVIPTDIINIGRLCGINACLLGFAPAVPFKNQELAKKMGEDISVIFPFNKIIGYLSNLIIALDKQITAQHYTVMIDDKDYSGNYNFIRIANGPYYNDSMVSIKGAIPDDGLLNIELFKTGGFLKNMRTMGRYFRRKEITGNINILAKKITIRSDELIWVQLDGEYFQDNNLTIEARPGVLQVAAPNDLTYQKQE